MAKTAQEIIDEEKKKAQAAKAKAFAEGGKSDKPKADDKKLTATAVDKEKEEADREKLRKTTKPDFTLPPPTTGKE